MPELTEHELRILARPKLAESIGYLWMVVAALGEWHPWPTLPGPHRFYYYVELPLFFLCGLLWVLVARVFKKQRAGVLATLEAREFRKIARQGGPE